MFYVRLISEDVDVAQVISGYLSDPQIWELPLQDKFLSRSVQVVLPTYSNVKLIQTTYCRT